MFITPEVNIAGNSVHVSRVLTIVAQIIPSTNLPTHNNYEETGFVSSVIPLQR